MSTKNTLPTMDTVTNLYLYGQENLLSEEERLDFNKVVNDKERTLKVDVNAFMNKQNEPGRFVTAADFPFVGAFLNPNAYLFDEKDPYKNYYSQELIQKLINLPKGVSYKKKDILDILQYGSAEQTLGFYDDGQDDVLERAYIWNTTAFKISEDAVFVVDKEGNRYIENFAIVPHSNLPNNEKGESGKYGIENFDFKGGFFSEIVNGYLKRNIDPSGIGKTVEIIFTGKRQVEKESFTYEDFVKEQERKSHFSLLTGAKTGYETLSGELIQRLWDSGSIQHLYRGKPIIYGSTENDVIEKAITPTGLNLDLIDEISNSSNPDELPITHPLNKYVTNGIVYVTGDGNDTITGTAYPDIMIGGKGNDYYLVGNGDTISDSDGQGGIYLKSADGSGYDRIYAGKLEAVNGDTAIFVNRDLENNPKFIYEAKGYKAVEQRADLFFVADSLKITRVSDGHQITIDAFYNGDFRMDFWKEDRSHLQFAIDLSAYVLSLLTGKTIEAPNIEGKEITGGNSDGPVKELEQPRNEPPNNSGDNQSNSGNSNNNDENIGTKPLPSGSESEKPIGTTGEQPVLADSYVFYKNHGQQTIDLVADKADKTKLNLIGVNYADARFRREGDDLVLTGQGEDSVRIKYFYYSEDYQLKNIQFSDRTLTLEEMKNGGFTLSGTDGDDVINDWQSERSVLDGGKGNDLLRGYFGSDTYLFRKGHGQDVIEDDTKNAKIGVDQDIIRFADVKSNEVQFRRDGDDLVLSGYHEGDSVKIRWFFSHEVSQIERIEFSDRTLTLEQLKNEGMTLNGTDGDDVINDWQSEHSVLDGGKGNDLLRGYFGSDTYLFRKGHGQDVIEDDTKNAKIGVDQDIIRFADVKSSEVQFRRDGDDLVLSGYHEGDSVKIRWFFSHEVSQIERIEFSDRTLTLEQLKNEGMTLNGTDGDDVINDWQSEHSVLDGGKGNDLLRGYFGSDTYLFRKGHGQDVIEDDTKNAKIGVDQDIIRFADVKSNEVQFRRDGDDLVLSGYHEGDSVKIRWFFSHEVSQIERIEFSDRTLTLEQLKNEGMTLNGTDGDDTIHDWDSKSVIDAGDGNDTVKAADGDDVLIGNRGNDTLIGGLGADTYVFQAGHGQDVIHEDSNRARRATDIDRIALNGVNYDQVQFRQQDGDLILSGYHQDDSITIKGFYGHIDYQVETLQFADRTLTLEHLKQEGKKLFGTDGDDTIHDWDGKSVIDAGDGNDTVKAADGDDILIGNRGNDTLIGGLGADTYVFQAGHGQDVIHEDSNRARRATDIDRIALNGVNYDQVQFRQQDNDLILSGYHQDDSITIKGFYGHIDYQVETLQFADRTLTLEHLKQEGKKLFGTDGNDTIHDWDGKSVIDAGDGNDTVKAADGDDILIGNRGNDTLIGGLGADTYVFQAGHGQDVIHEDSNRARRATDIDRIALNGVNYDQVKFRQQDNDLILSGYHQDDSITIKGFYEHIDYQPEWFDFADRSLKWDNATKMLVEGTAEEQAAYVAGYNRLIGAMATFNAGSTVGDISLTPQEDKSHLNLILISSYSPGT